MALPWNFKVKKVVNFPNLRMRLNKKTNGLI